ncbi:MAG: hypothetical protein JWR21_54 [Herminiimonas sp.]|nr:hypothetical protein [Herminiimonas sp.]
MVAISGVDALTPEGTVVAAFCLPQKTGEFQLDSDSG